MTTEKTDWQRALLLLRTYQKHYLVAFDADERLAAMADRREASAALVAHSEAALAAKRQEKGSAETQRRDCEGDIEAQKAHLASLEAKLYAIKTNKEYQAALKEVADGKRQIREREDQALQLMEAIESLEKDITQLFSAAADTKSACDAQLAALAQEEAALVAARDQARAECAALEREIVPEAWRPYVRVRQRFADALCTVAGGVCQGCNMRVPPQQFVALSQHRGLVDCPACHRLLYYTDEAEGAAV